MRFKQRLTILSIYLCKCFWFFFVFNIDLLSLLFDSKQIRTQEKVLLHYCLYPLFCVVFRDLFHYTKEKIADLFPLGKVPMVGMFEFLIRFVDKRRQIECNLFVRVIRNVTSKLQCIRRGQRQNRVEKLSMMFELWMILCSPASYKSPRRLCSMALIVSCYFIFLCFSPFYFSGYFPLESVHCLVWMCLDVLFCTASIMHLCTISIDRYLSLRYPMRFGRNKTRKRVTVKIIFVWLLSIAMSLPLCLMYSKVSEHNRY